MTATGKVVYVVGKQKSQADKREKSNAKRIAEAFACTAKYVRKRKAAETSTFLW